jgi:hypothetical protein
MRPPGMVISFTPSGDVDSMNTSSPTRRSHFARTNDKFRVAHHSSTRNKPPLFLVDDVASSRERPSRQRGSSV